MPDSARQSVWFPDVYSKPVVVECCDQPMSTDGGALLLIPIDRALQLTASLAAALDDPRQTGKVRHEVVELVRQRVFAIAHGYPDGNDAATLARDPALLLACERSPMGGEPLASQPTLSRFENTADPRRLLRMAEALGRTVLAHQQQTRRQRPPRLLRLDIDPTCDPTHGQQEFSVFNGFYGTSCYLPLLVTMSFDAEPTKYLVAAGLRPDNASAMTGTLGVLQHLVELVREDFPQVRLRLRADSAFAVPQLLECLEAAGLEYVIGMPTNAVLTRASQRLLSRARALPPLGSQGDAVWRSVLPRGELVATAAGRVQGGGGGLAGA